MPSRTLIPVLCRMGLALCIWMGSGALSAAETVIDSMEALPQGWTGPAAADSKVVHSGNASLR